MSAKIMQFLHDFHTANETFAVKFDFALSKLVLVHEDDVHAEAIRNFLTHFFTAIHTDGTCVADCDENSEHGNVVQLQNCEIIRKFNAHADFRRRRQSSFRQASLGDRRRVIDDSWIVAKVLIKNEISRSYGCSKFCNYLVTPERSLSRCKACAIGFEPN